MLHINLKGHLCSTKEDFKTFLPYMGMVAILIMWPGPFEQTLVPPSKGDTQKKFASMGLAVVEVELGSIRVPVDAYQVSRSSAFWF